MNPRTNHRPTFAAHYALENPMAVLRRSPAAYWPNDCPDCKAPMEFAFAPTVHRRCTACPRTVTEAEALSPVSGLRSPVSP